MTAPMTTAADDIDRIMAVMAAAFDPQFGEAWTRRQIEDALLIGHCHYRLIANDGAPPAEAAPAAGFALLRAVAGEEELLLFAIAPQFRRRGLGAALLGIVMADAAARGSKRMMLEMRAGNPAEALYTAAGFAETGRRVGYYRTRAGGLIDAETFACPLTPTRT